MSYTARDRRQTGRQTLPPLREIPMATVPEEDTAVAELCRKNLAAQRRFNHGEGRSRTAGEGRGRR